MDSQTVTRLGAMLDRDGHALTSFEEIGLEDYKVVADEVPLVLERSDQFNDVTRGGMLMFRDEGSLAVGRRLVAPVFEALFADHAGTSDDFGMYCVNHYETGHSFRAHQDYFDGTVVIATTCGTRRFDIYEKEDEDDVFLTVDVSYTLNAGSIMLLNGFKNLGHAAECIEGPSVSVVADIAAAVRA